MEPTTNPNTVSWKRLECKDPGARGYHSSVLWEHYIITFGGNKDAHAPCLLNDIAILDLETGSLHSIKAVNKVPTARYGHSACLYQGNKIIIFGGYSDDSLNETGLLTITNKEPFSVEWEVVKTKGDEKVHRYGHTANLYENTMFVFGGTDQTQQSSNQLWCLNLNDFSWKLCDSDGAPGARTGHSSVIHDKSLYVFGGFSFQRSEFLNDLWKLDLSSLKWQQISPLGALPDVRRGSPAQEKDGKIYIFGGLHENKVKNSLCAYDIDKNTWELVSTQGETPAGRSAHTMICYKDNLIIWGGFDDLYTGLPDIYCLSLVSQNHSIEAGWHQMHSITSNLSRTQDSIGLSASLSIYGAHNIILYIAFLLFQTF